MNSETQTKPRTLREVRGGEPDDGAIALANIEASGALDDLELTGYEDEQSRRLKAAEHLFRKSGMVSLRPLLPLLLNLKGKPYTLKDHFPFEPFFRTRVPQKTLLKTGRQVSKTLYVSGKQRVLLANGRRVPGQDLRVGDSVLSVDAGWRVVPARVVATVRTGPKPGVRVRTRTGVEMDLALTHPLRRLEGWTVGADLKVGDRIAAARRGGAFGHADVPRERVVLTAYLLGDGSCVEQIGVTSECPEVLAEAAAAAAACGTPTNPTPKPGTDAVQLRLSKADGTAVRAWLEQDGLYGKYAWEKHVPAWVFDLSRDDTALFVSRLWATDGMITLNGDSPTVTYTSTSRDLAYDVKALLLKFGIPTSVKQREAGYKKPDGTYVRCRDAFVVRVETRDGWERFFDAFDVPGKPPVPVPDVEENNNRDTVPRAVQGLLSDIGKALRWKRTGSLASAGLRPTLKYPPTYEKLAAYRDHFRTHCPDHPRLAELDGLVDGDVLWDEIEEVTPLDPEPCWDVEVEGLHNYLLDGVVSHNSTSLAAQGIVMSNTIPYFSTLYVTPLYEMIRRFSSSYVKPFIETSPIGRMFSGASTMNSVLQRTFKNRSQMFFSFAYLDAERTRGIPSDKNVIDEVQDIDSSFLPIIHETMSGSPWQLVQYAGTPKTLDNTIERLWKDSSQAEWMIKCHRGGCGHWNCPSIHHDLLDMIGPYRADICEEEPGLVCAKCRKPLRPRTGRWVHASPDRRLSFAGYHVPQLILPMHCADPQKWGALLGKQEGKGNTAFNVFLNEVCGESWDLGSRIVTETDLRAAATLPWENKVEEAEAAQQGRYAFKVLAVDWGGGGESRRKNKNEGPSYTCMAAMGMTTDGRIEVFWGMRSLTPHDHEREARLCIGAIRRFGLSHLVHDYTGAGALRETIVNHCGFPYENLVPMYLGRTAVGDVMVPHAATDSHPRDFYVLDKPRSLQLTCHAVKTGGLRFFKYDYRNSDDQGLLHDFLALVEEKTMTRLGGDVYTITKDPNSCDDFAQAVNMGCAALWKMSGMWPKVAEMSRLQVDPGLAAAASGGRTAWEGEL